MALWVKILCFLPVSSCAGWTFFQVPGSDKVLSHKGPKQQFPLPVPRWAVQVLKAQYAYVIKVDDDNVVNPYAVRLQKGGIWGV